MRKLFSIGFLATLFLGLNACGGGDDAFQTPTDPGPVVSAVSVLASSPQLLSDDSAPVTITARVLNELNQAMPEVTVTFQTDSGVLTDIVATTNDSGVATAVLHNNSDLSSRPIVVTASVGAVSDTVTINVTGTRLTLSGAVAIAQGDSTVSTITLIDAGGHGIAGEAVTVTSANGNTLSAGSVTTDVNGQATVTITGSAGGADTITASALGMSATQTVTVSDDSFAFTTPAANTEIQLDNPATAGAVENNTRVTVAWSISGTPQAGEDINFSTTRGTLYQYAGACTTTPLTTAVTTDGAGQASACVAATNAGPATLSATSSSATTALRLIEFVATTPAAMNLQASPTTITTSGQSTITAVVRDANNNLVKNKTVVFTLNDVTGGTLTVGSATTDSQGRAQTIYTASGTTSAANGVSVTATVQGTAVTASTTLTVAKRELFISLGTGNELTDDVTRYEIPYSVQVTDANGNGVPNIDLTVRVSSLWYATGTRFYDTVAAAWGINAVDVCLDEDMLLGAADSGYRNGILDPGEDFNLTGRLEAGNIATVTPSTVTTDANGFADIQVVYPQEYAFWMKVELAASTSVQGTESERTVSFVLPGSKQDFQDATSNPPGQVSPFGVQNYGCPNPPAPLFP